MRTYCCAILASLYVPWPAACLLIAGLVVVVGAGWYHVLAPVWREMKGRKT